MKTFVVPVVSGPLVDGGSIGLHVYVRVVVFRRLGFSFRAALLVGCGQRAVGCFLRWSDGASAYMYVYVLVCAGMA